MTPLLQDALAVLGTLEVAEVADRILEAVVRATRARGAALWVARDGGELELQARRGTQGRDAVAFPLLAGAETVGLIHLQPPDGALAPGERAAASALARVASVALGNALRFEALRARTLRDEVSDAYSLAYLRDHAGKELDKALRYRRHLSLAVVALEEGGEALGAPPESMGAMRRAMVAAVSRAVREADVLAHASGGTFHALLPETDHFGALVFVRRAGDEVRRDPELRRLLGRVPRIALGAATFPGDGGSLEELLQACRGRQDEYRASMLHQLPEAGGTRSFWELVDLLLGDAALAPGTPSARLRATPELVACMHRELAREIGRTARVRGVAYVAAPSEEAVAPLVRALPRLEGADRAGDLGVRVHLLAPPGAGGDEGSSAAHPLVARVIVEGDRRIERHPFVLFLSRETAYGVVQGDDGALFHTSDLPLVDLLVERLQHQYDLRPVEAV